MCVGLAMLLIAGSSPFIPMAPSAQTHHLGRLPPQAISALQQVAFYVGDRNARGCDRPVRLPPAPCGPAEATCGFRWAELQEGSCV